MTDVLLRHEADGGNIEYVGGRSTMDNGLETCAFLALAGGNELDSGEQADEPVEWWGNKIERVESRKYRSRFQNLIQSLPLVPANLGRFEEAAALDLQFLVDENIASYVGTVARITGLNRVEVEVQIVVDDVAYNYVFTFSARERALAAAAAEA